MFAALLPTTLLFLTVNGQSEYSTPTPYAPTTAFSYSYGTFSYAPMASPSYATPLKSPLKASTTYAPPFSKASHLLDPHITYTTYSLRPKATTKNDGPYGQSAYAQLWANASLSYSDHPPFTTTVSPTPVASSELLKPPPASQILAHPGDASNLEFPSDFVWGVASSAWQIEGGLKVEGRGPSTDDTIGALPSTANDSNVDDMFYFYYKQDIKRLAAIGLPYFDFSIPWTRVVPFGVAGSPVNTQALDHYDDLINECIANGITPIITILHYDYPISLPYTDPGFVDGYLYYAKQVMTRYGDRVPFWETMNEVNLQPVNNGLTNALTAHARLYRWYKDELKGTGTISMKFANNLAIPQNTNSKTDLAAAQRYQDFSLGVMNNPVFLGEQIPESVLSTKNINITAYTDEQIELFNGTMDFFSFDPYSAQYVTSPPGGIEACASDPSNPLWPTCVVTTNVGSDGWLIGEASNVTYSFIDPQYVRAQMAYPWDTFRPAGGIMITEYGFPVNGEGNLDEDGQRYDLNKSLYYYAYLREVLKAINLDGVKVIGALAWSFVNTNEFGTFDTRYGLQTVNHTTFERRYKRSFFDYVDFFHQHVASS